MSESEKDNITKVTSFLEQRGVNYTLYRHEAVVSVEDSMRVIHIDNCLGCKSLFVKDKKSDNYYMAILPAQKRADMRGIARVVGKEKFEFATAETMLNMLNVVRGNVTPFCFIEHGKDVALMIDAELKNAPRVRFHPLDNSATVVLATYDFFNVCTLMGKTIIWI